MSSIEKIMIRGIRSFEADSGEAATITFYSPLTLITGHNGSGKTTIIECLKYATTGDLPPNSKGGAFVNDPKMSGSPTVKAQVRLRFKNVNHQTMTVTRSLSLTVKKAGVTQKTLENVLAAVDPSTGELVSVSSKCSEIDTDVPNNLGVSRAILDNVIFCHQEESNWPLSEPSLLKKKFDEIFASTKYTNVLDSIKAIRKEKAVELKVMFNSLEFLRRNKEKAQKIRESLTSNEESTKNSQQRIEQLDIDLDRCAEDISRLMTKTREIQQIETTLSAISHELRSTQSNIKDLEGKFDLYNESDSDLNEMLFKHDLSLKTADQEKAKQERTKQRTATTIANLQASVSQNQQSIGQFKALLDNNKKKQTDRDLLIAELANQYTLGSFNSTPLVNSDVKRFIGKLEMQVQQKVGEVERIKQESRQKEQEVRSELSDRKAKLDMASSLKAKNQSAISSAQSKLRQQQAELSKYKSTDSEIESTEIAMAEQESALTALRSSGPGQDSLESQRRAKMADVEAFENDLSRLSEQIAAQAKNAGSQARLTLLKNKHSQRSERIKALMLEHGDGFQNVLKEAALPETVEDSLAPILKSKEAALRSSRESLEKYKRELSSQEIFIENVASQLKKHTKAVEDCEKQVAVQCDGWSLPELLQSKEETLTELREQVQDLKTMSTMYERFVAMAEKKHGCPLCSRGFDPTFEAQFTAKLRRLMEKAENDDEQELVAVEATVTSLRALKSEWDAVEKLKTSEIPSLKAQLSELESKRTNTLDSIESVDLETISLTAELEELRELASAAKDIASLCRENGGDQSAISALETELLVSGSSQSTEAMQTEYNTVKQKVQAARQEVNKLQQEMAQMTAEVQRKEQVIRTLKDKHNKLLNQRERKTQVEEQIVEIEASIQHLTAEMQQHELDGQDVMPEMNRLNELLRQTVAEGQAKERSVQQVVTEMRNNLEKVQMYNKDIERVDSRATMLELSRLEGQTEQYTDEIAQHQQEIQATEKQMQGLQEQLAEFKNLQRNIEDNLRYRRYKKKAEELEAQYAETAAKKDGEAQGTYTRQLTRLSQRQSDLSGERAGLKGELRQLQDQRRTYEDELNVDYKDVVPKYHENLINCKTTELALEDLEKYAKALQSAIVDYHTMKMEEVNKTIKELWTNTYQGTDIDTIEIRSDQEGLRANQSYNYRVVMIQDGRAQDMRGRCSAGQKVLASIIIRLALAESFSVSCGILALDEPTTNLDHANIVQLAHSLKDIVNKHRQQSNFQLIIITHDEEFLKMINLSDYADYYYKVLKNEEQYSTIRKLAITREE
ncbi:DNA repair protein RAD50 [Entomortierella parvispora]|uniref:DNA repair protein RAD50 n=1 Tax=Entomortierella parvispora TaxID=205924 RepID=A0A9P3M0M8_9FUNG|nr:DNA repair protein RAD50 [Entomortierella parvispora]